LRRLPGFEGAIDQPLFPFRIGLVPGWAHQLRPHDA
jgi:hypothetical protein